MDIPDRIPTLKEIEALERFARAVRRRGQTELAREAEYQAALARRLRGAVAMPSVPS